MSRLKRQCRRAGAARVSCQGVNGVGRRSSPATYAPVSEFVRVVIIVTTAITCLCNL
jgi:hypothetical protein